MTPRTENPAPAAAAPAPADAMPIPAPGAPSGTAAPAALSPASPRRGLVALLTFAIVGAGAAQMSAALLTLTLKATALDAASAATTISLSSAIAGALTLVALPTVGAMSDRSRSRLGRRRPFLLLGAVSFAAGGITLVLAPSVPFLVLAHLLLTLGFVTAHVTVTALMTDQLPSGRRGVATALISMSTAIGALLGMAVSVPFGDALLPLVGIPTLFAVAGMTTLALAVRDPQRTQIPPRLDLLRTLGLFWVDPRRHASFTWVFTSRMLVFSGVAALNGYQAIFLLQHLHMDPAGLGTAILLTVIVNVGITLLVAPLVGRLSDRLDVRKPFVLAAALILAVGLVLAANAPSFGFYLVACTVVGLGQGVYFSVELSLATQVLPDPENPGKDLGILKIADNLPVTIVAAIAPALLAIGGSGQNFSALFLAGALAAVAGGLAITLVRGAR